MATGALTYDLSLKAVGLVVGIGLIAAHLPALLRPEIAQRWLKDFPRSRSAGTVLLALAALWSFALIWTIDLGEFAGLRNVMLIGIVVGAVLTWRFVDEFLAVRALGILALLAAEPLLCAAFLQPEASRLFLVFLAYVWLTAGLFWVGLPYLLRDQIQWVTASPTRWKLATLGGLGYGALLLFCALAFYS